MAARKRTTRPPASVDVRTLAAGFEKLTLAVNGMRADMDGMRADMDGMRADMDGMRAEIDGVRAEMRTGFGEVRGEISALRGELHAELADVRQEMRAGFAEVNGDLGLVKIAVLEHSRRLNEIRTALDRKVDREEVEPIVERVLSRVTAART